MIPAEESLHEAWKYNKIKPQNSKNASAQVLMEYFIPSEYLCFNAEEIVFSLKPRGDSEEPYEQVRLSDALIQQIKKAYALTVFASQKKAELQTHMENTTQLIETMATSPHPFMGANITALKYDTPEGYGYFIPENGLCFNTAGVIFQADQPGITTRNTDPSSSHHSFFKRSKKTTEPYKTVKLPETLIRQVLELYKATHAAKAGMEALLSSEDFKAAFSSQENPSEVASKHCVMC